MSTVVGIHDGHNASVAVVRDGRIELALQEERLTRVKNQGDLPRLAALSAMEVVNGDLSTACVALNGRYMNYGQWSREKIEVDYRRSSAPASRFRQSLKGTWIDRRYQTECARKRETAIATSGSVHTKFSPWSITPRTPRRLITPVRGRTNGCWCSPATVRATACQPP